MNYMHPRNTFLFLSEPTNNTFITEDLLQKTWSNYHNKFIHTNIGEILILSPGERNFSAGPDFLNSIIKLPNSEIIKGSVEIHINKNDWEKHNHQNNPLYKNVILHIYLYENTNKSYSIIEANFNFKKLINKQSDPCKKINISSKQLIYILNDLAEIRFKLKMDKVSYDLMLIKQLFSFLKLNDFKEEKNHLIKVYENLLNNNHSTNSIIRILLSEISKIKWQGGRKPEVSQRRKIPIIIITHFILKNNLLTKDISLSLFSSLIKEYNRIQFQIAGGDFIKEIYGNIILPYLSFHLNIDLFNSWENIKENQYGIVTKRVNTWNIKFSNNFSITQGILFLEKSYCQTNSCENCPLFLTS